MRVIFSLLTVCIVVSARSQSAYPDVLHYDYRIELSDDHDTIDCTAIILLLTQETVNSINLDLGSLRNETGYGMHISELSVTDQYSTEVKYPAYAHEHDLIQIQKTFIANDTATIHIRYRGIPSDGLIISKNKYGNRTFFADHWPERAHHWLACHDDPADKASVEFKVLAPQHYQVVANGIQLEESSITKDIKVTHWNEDIPLSTKVMVIGVADFAVNLAGYVEDCIPVYSWVYPEDREPGFYDYALAKEILPFYIKYIGPYAYKKLANVESKTRFGGLENANTIFYSERMIKGDRSNETTIAHEIAHQWFGNMATEKTFAHLWLSEGFATYMTMLYMEEKYGRDKMNELLLKSRIKVIEYAQKKSIPVVDTMTKDYMKLLNANSYDKGAWILHMLRVELGDSLFHVAIKKYYAQYAGGTADTEDLLHIFENVSGKNLRIFFNQWLYTPGQPSLNLNWTFDPGTNEISVKAEQTQKTVFDFPLDLMVITEDGKKIKQAIRVHQRQGTWTIKADSRPIRLVPDPDTNLLFSYIITPSK